MRTIAAVAASLLLTGCPGSPFAVSASAPEKLAVESDDTLCNAYAVLKAKNAQAELTRREAIPARDWGEIDAGKVYVGMSRLAAICSWGWPDDINRTTTSYGSTEQWVYTDYEGRIEGFLYVEDNKISTIQN